MKKYFYRKIVILSLLCCLSFILLSGCAEGTGSSLPVAPETSQNGSSLVTHEHQFDIKREGFLCKPGTNIYTCACGYSYEERAPIEAEHTLKYLPEVSGDCNMPGMTGGAVCKVCGMVVEEPSPLIYDHEYFGGSCTRCQTPDPRPVMTTGICGENLTFTVYHANSDRPTNRAMNCRSSAAVRWMTGRKNCPSMNIKRTSATSICKKGSHPLENVFWLILSI